MKTYIVGHKNPDTDSIVSAIALEALEKAENKDCVASRAGELNKETKYVLNRFGFEAPVLLPKGDKKVILVDHNETSQLDENISLNEIQCIIDHHKLGGLSLPGPISVRTKPLGSTATIIAGIFEEDEIEIQPEIASILIAGIISDTLNFVSPTTTDRDRKTLSDLNKIAKLNVDKLAEEMFAAKSDISDIATEELLEKDYKVFSVGDKKIGFGVWETVLPDMVLQREMDILKLLDSKKATEGLDLIYFSVVDILNNYSKCVICGEAERQVAEPAFGGAVDGHLMLLPGVVSRKKQMVPPLEKFFSK